MSLRERISSAMADRITAIKEDALRSIWGTSQLTVVFEALRFGAEGGERDGFAHVASVEGMVRVDLYVDQAQGTDPDALPVEDLVANLIENPVLIIPQPDLAPGSLTHRARLRMTDLRDTVRETHAVATLRLALEGSLLRVDPGPAIPDTVITRTGDSQETIVGDAA